MRAFIEGFNQRELLKLGLGPIEALLLQWFKSFSLSDRQRYLDRGDERYYWVKYSKVILDLPCLYIANPKRIGKLFGQLIGQGRDNPENYPLKKIRANVDGVQELYFKFNAKVLKKLEGSDMGGLSEELGIKVKKQNKNWHKRPLDPNVFLILQDLKDIDIESGGKSLFSFKQIQDRHIYTKAIERFGCKLKAIYLGIFKHDYKIDFDFLTRNTHYYDPETIREKLSVCKGDWSQIRAMVVIAAERYKTWFYPHNEPQNKKWLTRDISSWIYCEHNQQSMFYLNLSKEASPLREVDAEDMFDRVPGKVQRIAEEIKQLDWDGYSFWSKIWSVVSWWNSYSVNLIKRDSNAMYWLEGGLNGWFRAYIDWMKQSMTTGLWLANLGTDCKTWEYWLCWAKKEYGIEIELPEK